MSDEELFLESDEEIDDDDDDENDVENDDEDENEDEDDDENSKDEKKGSDDETDSEYSEEPVKKKRKKVSSTSSIKTKLEKKKNLNPRIEKLLQAAAKEQKHYKMVVHKEPEMELTTIKCKVPVRKQLKSTVTEHLSSPLGLEKDELRLRVQRSEATKFDIQQEFFLKHTRFIPFGSTFFFQNTNRFYTQPTSLSCWWCTEPFSNLPIPVPVKYHENKANPEATYFLVNGVFCSPSCMLAYSFKRDGKETLARLLLKKCYSLPVSKVERAPDYRTLKKFGGAYDIEEFRATGGSGVTTEPLEIPFLPFCAGIQEIARSTKTILESGTSKEVAIRHITHNSNYIPRTTSEVHLQKTKFCQLPSIDFQIQALSNQQYVLQQQTQKKVGILNFMRIK